MRAEPHLPVDREVAAGGVVLHHVHGVPEARAGVLPDHDGPHGLESAPGRGPDGGVPVDDGVRAVAVVRDRDRRALPDLAARGLPHPRGGVLDRALGLVLQGAQRADREVHRPRRIREVGRRAPRLARPERATFAIAHGVHERRRDGESGRLGLHGLLQLAERVSQQDLVLARDVLGILHEQIRHALRFGHADPPLHGTRLDLAGHVPVDFRGAATCVPLRVEHGSEEELRLVPVLCPEGLPFGFDLLPSRQGFQARCRGLHPRIRRLHRDMAESVVPPDPVVAFVVVRDALAVLGAHELLDLPVPRLRGLGGVLVLPQQERASSRGRTSPRVVLMFLDLVLDLVRERRTHIVRRPPQILREQNRAIRDDRAAHAIPEPRVGPVDDDLPPQPRIGPEDLKRRRVLLLEELLETDRPVAVRLLEIRARRPLVHWRIKRICDLELRHVRQRHVGDLSPPLAVGTLLPGRGELDLHLLVPGQLVPVPSRQHFPGLREISRNEKRVGQIGGPPLSDREREAPLAVHPLVVDADVVVSERDVVPAGGVAVLHRLAAVGVYGVLDAVDVRAREELGRGLRRAEHHAVGQCFIQEPRLVFPPVLNVGPDVGDVLPVHVYCA